MCYAAPGPRCSSHAREKLEKARATFKETNAFDDFEALKEAQDEFYTTPAGFRELEAEYARTNNIMVKFLLQERKMERNRKLRDIGVFHDEGTDLVNPASLTARALSADSDYTGEKPKWWNDYASAAQGNENPALATSPELLDVFDSPLGKVAVVWEPISQADNDKVPQEERGIRVSTCRFRHMKTGEDVGYLKASYMDDQSVADAYGKDEFTVFRHRAENSGSSYSYPFEDKEGNRFTSVAPEDLAETRRKVWLGVHKDLDIAVRTSDGKSVMPWSLTEEHIPADDAQVRKDLKKHAKRFSKEMDSQRAYFKTPFVDFSRVVDSAKGQGYGSALYVYTARRLAKNGTVLRGSSLQSDEATQVWERFKKKMPEHVKFITMDKNGEPTKFPILDFRSQAEQKAA